MHKSKFFGANFHLHIGCSNILTIHSFRLTNTSKQPD
nr:MAG TPA: hypothetical protein [Caudoviricetes sp.]